MEETVKTLPNSEKFYRNSTYEIISKVAYLIGVPQRIFANEFEPPKIEVFDRLEKNRNARIVRDLCIIRTAIERNFKKINNEMRYSMKSILSLPNYVPQETIYRLTTEGINFYKKSNTQLSGHIVELNRLISDRINNCREIFPDWLNWEYIRQIFIMPEGLDESKTGDAASIYYAGREFYPYQMYMNWTPQDEGNILYCDKKFVTLLYKWHGKEFTDFGKVSDVGSYVKGNIYDFINDSEKVVIVVDCENVDPYRLSATLRGLNKEYLDKIPTIILFDDIHASTGWDLISQFTTIHVEHIEIERIKENKSLVDMRLAMRVSQEYYENHVSSFVLVSSDSDYWALISSLPQVKFLVMVEHEKCGPDLKKALSDHGIFYCYLDDFYSGNSEEMKIKALLREINIGLGQAVQLNLNELLDAALYATRINMEGIERQRFYNKYVKPLKLEISDDGEVNLSLKIK